MVVHDAHRRQPCAQDIHTVSDQRGDDDCVDCVAAQPFAEQMPVGAIVDRRFGNRIGQGQSLQGWTDERSVVQLQPFAGTFARMTAACDENQVAGCGKGLAEIADPAFGTAAPAMQHVQQYRSIIQTRPVRVDATGEGLANADAQRSQRRRWQRVARVGAGDCALQGLFN